MAAPLIRRKRQRRIKTSVTTSVVTWQN